METEIISSLQSLLFDNPALVYMVVNSKKKVEFVINILNHYETVKDWQNCEYLQITSIIETTVMSKNAYCPKIKLISICKTDNVSSNLQSSVSMQANITKDPKTPICNDIIDKIRSFGDILWATKVDNKLVKIEGIEL